MSTWSVEELDKIGAAEELEISAFRSDGRLWPYTTIWVVRVGDDLYVRSVRGRDGVWFRHVLEHPEGRIRAGGVERDVTFDQPQDADHDTIDRAYQTKYVRYADNYVPPIVSPVAVAATIRLVPR